MSLVLQLLATKTITLSGSPLVAIGPGDEVYLPIAYHQGQMYGITSDPGSGLPTLYKLNTTTGVLTKQADFTGNTQGAASIASVDVLIPQRSICSHPSGLIVTSDAGDAMIDPATGLVLNAGNWMWSTPTPPPGVGDLGDQRSLTYDVATDTFYEIYCEGAALATYQTPAQNYANAAIPGVSRNFRTVSGYAATGSGVATVGNQRIMADPTHVGRFLVYDSTFTNTLQTIDVSGINQGTATPYLNGSGDVSFGLDQYCRGVAWDGNYLWLTTNPQANTEKMLLYKVSVMSIATYAIAAPRVQIQLSAGVGVPIGFASNGTAYTIDVNNDGQELLSLNTNTGALTDVGGNGDTTNPTGIGSLGSNLLICDPNAGVFIVNPSDGSIISGGNAFWNFPAGGDGALVGGVASDSSGAIVQIIPSASGDFAALYAVPAFGTTPVLAPSGSIGLGMGTDKACGITPLGTSWLIGDRNANGALRTFNSAFAPLTTGALTYMASLPFGVAIKPNGSILITGDDGYEYNAWKTDGVQTMPAGTVWHGGTASGIVTFSGAGTITTDLAAMTITGTVIINGVLTINKGANAFTDTGAVYKLGPNGRIVPTGGVVITGQIQNGTSAGGGVFGLASSPASE